MNAKYLVLLMGQRLIGRTVLTEPMGIYPGGPAKVTEINPDPAAPEIVMQVEHPTWRDDGDNERGSIGVFSYEELELLPD